MTTCRLQHLHLGLLHGAQLIYVYFLHRHTHPLPSGAFYKHKRVSAGHVYIPGLLVSTLGPLLVLCWCFSSNMI
ncbi:hypothetical protein B0H15DRAFT_832049 [Mycena belliarum]|uniref:Uncharacterized protein n=1 Tax=Mycena belliarum TaxID=1033014 RepID=A0AAD6XWP2_9AGAR|nr:hypothetical protein B0H15DRAFT_832049 [Mycena belliae]